MSRAAIRHRARGPVHAAAPSPKTIEAAAPILKRLPLGDLKCRQREVRKHTEHQLTKLAQAIRQFGFLSPIVVDTNLTILAGHARYAAALKAGLQDVPVVLASHLSETQKRGFILADNKLAELAVWDLDVLRIELTELSKLDLDFSLDATGFSTPEIDVILASDKDAEREESMPEVSAVATTRPGDLWRLGKHSLYCGDAREEHSYAILLNGAKSILVVTDPPYNVKVDGHVGGRGKIKHREFAMASGEMTDDEFIRFLHTVCTQLKAHSTDGSLQYIFMDHRHIDQLLAACKAIYNERVNILVWKKSNAGMGALYRSQHEFIFVYKNGIGRHINNVELGAYGRNRTNVLEYPGANTFRAGRQDELSRHPTPKTVELIADLIRDASNRGDLVLDCFAGGGTIFIAAEKTHRVAAGIEIDPIYCDVSIERWQGYTGQHAIHVATGKTFDILKRERSDGAAIAGESASGAALEESAHA